MLRYNNKSNIIYNAEKKNVDMKFSFERKPNIIQLIIFSFYIIRCIRNSELIRKQIVEIFVYIMSEPADSLK